MSEMLADTTSYELSELAAYELINGPIGGRYSEELLADIHQQLQRVCSILIAQHVEHEQQVPQPQRYPRPHDVLDHLIEGDEDA